MVAKKSNAQIKRMMKRAEARGEKYVPPEPVEESENAEESSPKKTESSGTSTTAQKSNLSADEKAKLDAAVALEKDLEKIQNDESLKSKDRRSSKRKAEAIACEASGCASSSELLEWYEEFKNKQEQKGSSSNTKRQDRKKRNPYIVFIGQLAYDTSAETLFGHFQKELGAEHKVTVDTLKVRLLTNPKTKKSRGMAFVEVTDPELLYSCLKLHHTFLEGRRINVERSAGGNSNSEARKSKIQKLREEQSDHFSSVVETMLTEFYDNGSIKRGELDDGVIGLCKRHSAAVVQAALEEYVEKQGHEMDNPSAYLTFLLGKMAEEGIREKEETKSNDDNKGKRHSSGGKTYESSPKKAKSSPSMADQGVDMSISEPTGDRSSSGQDMSSIFPSYSRGRGRGR